MPRRYTQCALCDRSDSDLGLPTLYWTRRCVLDTPPPHSTFCYCIAAAQHVYCNFLSCSIGGASSSLAKLPNKLSVFGDLPSCSSLSLPSMHGAAPSPRHADSQSCASIAAKVLKQAPHTGHGGMSASAGGAGSTAAGRLKSPGQFLKIRLKFDFLWPSLVITVRASDFEWPSPWSSTMRSRAGFRSMFETRGRETSEGK